MSGGVRIGVDLGGTKIEAVALGPERLILRRERIATPRGDYRGTIDAIAELIDRAEAEVGRADSIGVGTPGSVSPTTGLHRNANSTWLNGRPFVGDLETRLGRAIRTANDANCFALSEALLGAGRGAAVVFGVILGTGVGGGVVIDGVARAGRNGVAGEWGHSPLPGASEVALRERPCYCGLSGCREQFLSGPAIEGEYRAASGRPDGLAAIARRAADGDAVAVAAIDRLVERLARSLAEVVNLLDPDCIVLGGGVSNLDVLYARLPDLVRRYAFTDSFETPIRRAEGGDSSGVLGAALL